MDAPSILLASASPRRRRLLAWLAADYECLSTNTDEDLDSPLRGVPPVLARSLAADKARAARGARPDTALILAFDTIVVMDRRVLGKPADVEEARTMLESLSGRVHDVVTGSAFLLAGESEPTTFAVTTPVAMRELDTGAISDWLAGDEALGCAGAYNIERHLATVEQGECYQNVAGLPLCHLFERLARAGVQGISAPIAECEAALGRECPLGRRLCRNR